MPSHPFTTHFPIVLAFLIPVLAAALIWPIKNKKLTPKLWLLVIGFQIAATATGYITLESGENDEEVVEKVLDKKLIHPHEEKAEIFVGSLVIGLVISIVAFFLDGRTQLSLQVVVALVGLASAYLACATGELGGKLVYQHGAARAFTGELKMQFVPTPSPTQLLPEDNESLKADEHDYGSTEEIDDDENEKMED